MSKSKCTKHLSFGALLEVEMSKKCTPLWREAPFPVKMYKAHQVRTTFWSWDVEKVHAVVARSTFRSQNVQSTSCSDHFWKLRYRKSARGCGAKHISKSKSTKHHMYAPLLDVEASFCVAGARDCDLVKAKRERFVAFPKRWQAWDIWRGSAKRHFPWQAQCFVWPGITFSWQAQYFRQVDWKNRKTHWYEAVSAARNFPYLKEVWQKCFVLDGVKFQNWGSLAGLLRFGCCQV